MSVAARTALGEAMTASKLRGGNFRARFRQYRRKLLRREDGVDFCLYLSMEKYASRFMIRVVDELLRGIDEPEEVLTRRSRM